MWWLWLFTPTPWNAYGHHTVLIWHIDWSRAQSSRIWFQRLLSPALPDFGEWFVFHFCKMNGAGTCGNRCKSSPSSVLILLLRPSCLHLRSSCPPRATPPAPVSCVRSVCLLVALLNWSVVDSQYRDYRVSWGVWFLHSSVFRWLLPLQSRSMSFPVNSLCSVSIFLSFFELCFCHDLQLSPPPAVG